jgi:hypothetical protein
MTIHAYVVFGVCVSNTVAVKFVCENPEFRNEIKEEIDGATDEIIYTVFENYTPDEYKVRNPLATEVYDWVEGHMDDTFLANTPYKKGKLYLYQIPGKTVTYIVGITVQRAPPTDLKDLVEKHTLVTQLLSKAKIEGALYSR